MASTTVSKSGNIGSKGNNDLKHVDDYKTNAQVSLMAVTGQQFNHSIKSVGTLNNSENGINPTKPASRKSQEASSKFTIKGEQGAERTRSPFCIRENTAPNQADDSSFPRKTLLNEGPTPS